MRALVSGFSITQKWWPKPSPSATKSYTECTFYYFGNNSIQFILMRIGKTQAQYWRCLHARVSCGLLPYRDESVHAFWYFRSNNHLHWHKQPNRIAFFRSWLSIHVVFLHFVLHQQPSARKFLRNFQPLYYILFLRARRVRFKIYFGFNDMVKRQCISFNFGAGFFGIQHIVGARSHFSTRCWGGRMPLKGLIIAMIYTFCVFFHFEAQMYGKKVLKSGRGNNMENGKLPKRHRRFT